MRLLMTLASAAVLFALVALRYRVAGLGLGLPGQGSDGRRFCQAIPSNKGQAGGQLWHVHVLEERKVQRRPHQDIEMDASWHRGGPLGPRLSSLPQRRPESGTHRATSRRCTSRH